MSSEVTYSVHSCVHGYHFGWFVCKPMIVRTKAWFYSIRYGNRQIISIDYATRNEARMAAIGRAAAIKTREVRRP